MKETEPVILVYIGNRLGEKDELVPWWIAVTEEQYKNAELPPDAQAPNVYRSYSGKATKKKMTTSPGSVYRVPQEKGGTTIMPSEAQWLGLWDDQEKRSEWQLEHRTAVSYVDLRKREKKEGADDLFVMLKPIREKYSNLISQDMRAALLAQVIAYITRRG